MLLIDITKTIQLCKRISRRLLSNRSLDSFSSTSPLLQFDSVSNLDRGLRVCIYFTDVWEGWWLPRYQSRQCTLTHNADQIQGLFLEHYLLHFTDLPLSQHSQTINYPIAIFNNYAKIRKSNLVRLGEEDFLNDLTQLILFPPIILAIFTEVYHLYEWKLEKHYWLDTLNAIAS